jgi:c-di-GMP-binding flagellar brake protein YcgR
MDMNLQESPGNAVQERRVFERRKIVLDKSIKAEVLLESSDPRTTYIFIKDMSEGGLKIHSDMNLPVDMIIPIKFYLDSTLDVSVKVAWHKELGGMHIMGLQFMDITDEASGVVRAFMDRYSPEGLRRNYRLDRTLAFQIDAGEQSMDFCALALNISAEGMRLINEFILPEGKEFPLKIILETELPPVHFTAQVSWQKQTTFDNYMIGLNFSGVSPECSERIDAFLDKAINGTLDQPARKKIQ